MNKNCLVRAVCLAAIASASVQAQIDLSDVFPKQIGKVSSVFAGEMRLAEGTRLVVQSELAASVRLQAGTVTNKYLERPYVDVSLSKQGQAVGIGRGTELVVTGSILCYRTAFDMGDYAINLEVKGPDGSTGVIVIGKPEKGRRFPSARFTFYRDSPDHCCCDNEDRGLFSKQSHRQSKISSSCEQIVWTCLPNLT